MRAHRLVGVNLAESPRRLVFNVLHLQHDCSALLMLDGEVDWSAFAVLQFFMLERDSLPRQIACEQRPAFCPLVSHRAFYASENSVSPFSTSGWDFFFPNTNQRSSTLNTSS
jgi:hypothetical protein